MNNRFDILNCIMSAGRVQSFQAVQNGAWEEEGSAGGQRNDWLPPPGREA
jgi:hypothetical protein